MEGDGEVEEAEAADAGVWVDLPGFVPLKGGEEKHNISNCGE